MKIIKRIKADINSDGELDVTFKDILNGQHLDGNELYIISSKVETLKDVETRQAFIPVKPDGTFAKKFSSSVMSRNYNRLWVKSSRSYTSIGGDSVPRGMVICVPYDDPNGEVAYMPKDIKVKSYSVFLRL
jgi:hypothetical protein